MEQSTASRGWEESPTMRPDERAEVGVTARSVDFIQIQWEADLFLKCASGS